MVALSVLLFPIVNGIFTLRWWIICRRLKIKVTFNCLYQIYYAAWFLSAFPLLGISPIAKLLYLKESGQPAGTSAVSITLDKLFDIMGLLIFGIVGLIFFPQTLSNKTEIGIFIGVSLLAMLVIWICRGKLWQALMAFLKRYTNKKLQYLGSSLYTDLREFWSGFDKHFFTVMLTISIAIGVLRAFVLYVLAISLNISVSFGFIIICRAVIGLVNVVPVTVSGLGTRDAVLLFMMPFAGVSKETAIALGLTAFLWNLCSAFAGIFFWLNRPLPYKSFRNIKQNLIR